MRAINQLSRKQLLDKLAIVRNRVAAQKRLDDLLVIDAAVAKARTGTAHLQAPPLA